MQHKRIEAQHLRIQPLKYGAAILGTPDATTTDQPVMLRQ